ncbi:MAG: SDR family NAD(P)-dependent oxidoreductase [Thermoleophilia bacterium]|nr:SDR family NAD(P)-dependent oxidoreductase [Thermoleophilia bacterium]
MARTQKSLGQPGPRFVERYGAWALIAGASEGLGAAYARALAARGMKLVLIARRRGPLDDLAEEVHRDFGVEVRSYDGDLASVAFLESLQAVCADLDLGLVVCNAAQAPIGDFASRAGDELMRVVDVNVRAPMVLLRGLIPMMQERGRGAVILMTSLTGNLGTPRIASYAASKAFLRVLGESLWYELRDQGIDVLASVCGAVRTPGYATAAGKDAPGTLDADQVVERALEALGRGPVVIPGFVNRVAASVMTRLLPRRTAIGILARSTVSLADIKDTKGRP